MPRNPIEVATGLLDILTEIEVNACPRPWLPGRGEPVITRYELRSERGRSIIREVEDGAICNFEPAIPAEGTEIWLVNLEERDGALVETGSWPIIPASRAKARFA